MFCPHCGNQTDDNASFCQSCGKSLNNGTANQAQTQARPQQQYNQPQYNYAPQEVLSDKSKVAAGLLAFFLGGFGVHNFYLGYTGRAVAQLLITLLSAGFLSPIVGIWAFIEMIMIFAGSIPDAQKRKLR